MKYLETNQLTANPNLVKRLPADLAFRYHVLPLAESQECITVAMADPDDGIAREKISSYLGTPVYIIQSDREIIDARLAEIWMGEPQPKKVSILVCEQRTSKITDDQKGQPAQNDLIEYSRGLGKLIGARIHQVEIYSRSKDARARLVDTIIDGNYDLVAVSPSPKNALSRLIFPPPPCEMSLQINTSMLVVQEPRWPLRQVLLILRFDEIDGSAVNWAKRLAQLGHSTVTILPVTPLFPAMYASAVQEMLSPESITGRRFHEFIQQFEDLRIPHLIHHHLDVPDYQIQAEIASRQYDLVVIGAESARWAVRWLAGGLIRPLLLSASCPVLISKRPIVQ